VWKLLLQFTYRRKLGIISEECEFLKDIASVREILESLQKDKDLVK